MHAQPIEPGPLVHTHNVKSRLADCCIIPISPAILHLNGQNTTLARKAFGIIANREPTGPFLHHEKHINFTQKCPISVPV